MAPNNIIHASIASVLINWQVFERLNEAAASPVPFGARVIRQTMFKILITSGSLQRKKPVQFPRPKPHNNYAISYSDPLFAKKVLAERARKLSNYHGTVIL